MLSACDLAADNFCFGCRLAAETLAGLNSVHPRTAEEHSRSGTKSISRSSSESPPAPRKLSKQPSERKQKMKKSTAVHRPAPQPRHTDNAAASQAALGNSASMHPILGFSVPHARRSYTRDSAPHGKGSENGQVLSADGKALPFASSRPSPAKGRQHKANAGSNAHGKMAGPLRRVPSDSSMTVSADSNA